MVENKAGISPDRKYIWSETQKFVELIQGCEVPPLTGIRAHHVEQFAQVFGFIYKLFDKDLPDRTLEESNLIAMYLCWNSLQSVEEFPDSRTMRRLPRDLYSGNYSENYTRDVYGKSDYTLLNHVRQEVLIFRRLLVTPEENRIVLSTRPDEICLACQGTPREQIGRHCHTQYPMWRDIAVMEALAKSRGKLQHYEISSEQMEVSASELVRRRPLQEFANKWRMDYRYPDSGIASFSIYYDSYEASREYKKMYGFFE